jgi:uncharacterized protein (DUF58 family)
LPRFLLLSTIVHGLLLAGLVTLRGDILALAIPFALYLAIGFLDTPSALTLGVSRSFSLDRVSPGTEVVISLTIHNLGEEIDELYLEDRISSSLAVRGGSPRKMIRLRKGDAYTNSYTITGPRGAYWFDTIRVEAAGGINLFRRAQTLKAAGRLSVFPDVRRLKSISIRPRRTRVYAGLIPARVGGTGTDFFGVREYQPGDAPRAINWHATARHLEGLYSNEFQQERVADVGLVLDARERTSLFHGGASIFEYSIRAAAALADAFLFQGNRVGLLVYGNYLSWTLPGYGKIQRERILQALASASVGASTVFAGLQHLSPRMFPPHSQIVLISPLADEDLTILLQLRARGYQIMVISPDPVEFERAQLSLSEPVDLATSVVRMERNLLILRLKRAGIQVYEWNLMESFDRAVGSLLMRPLASRLARPA